MSILHVYQSIIAQEKRVLAGGTTVYLESGDYAFECYVKTNGVFHATSPGEGRLEMMPEFTVTDEKTDAPEPNANLTLSLKNSGMAHVDGALKAGMNTIHGCKFRVNKPGITTNQNDISGTSTDEYWVKT